MNKASYISIYLAAPLLAWLGAHIVKFVIALTKGRQDLSIFFKSGNMPSSHSAVVVALLIVIGSRQGWDSAIFGMAATLSAIVIFDAMNVRRSVGEQGDVLVTIAKKMDLKHPFFIAHGHTLPEVAAGVLLGCLTGFVLLQIL